MEIEHTTQSASTRKILHRFVQYTLLAGALGWLVGYKENLFAHLPYAMHSAEMFLIMLTLGLPVSMTILCTEPNTRHARVAVIWFSAIAATAILTISLLAGMLLAAVSAAACLTAVAALILSEKLWTRLRSATSSR